MENKMFAPKNSEFTTTVGSYPRLLYSNDHMAVVESREDEIIMFSEVKWGVSNKEIFKSMGMKYHPFYNVNFAGTQKAAGWMLKKTSPEYPKFMDKFVPVEREKLNILVPIKKEESEGFKTWKGNVNASSAENEWTAVISMLKRLTSADKIDIKTSEYSVSEDVSEEADFVVQKGEKIVYIKKL